MDLLTVKEAGELWGITARMVTLYCETGRIPGAFRKGNLWLIPGNAVKPADHRKKPKTKMVLLEPTTEYSRQIQAYRKEFLDCGDSMDGTDGLRRIEDPEEWIEHSCLSKEPEYVPEDICTGAPGLETVKMEREEMNSTNWSQSVAGVCLKDGKVLLARHTYGSGKGKLIIPGGYVRFGELPEETLVREYLEETGVKVRAGRLLGIRFNEKDWYVIFAAEYIDGAARSDGDENSEVVWMDIDDALRDDAVPGLTKALVKCALKGSGFSLTPYQTNKIRNQLYA